MAPIANLTRITVVGRFVDLEGDPITGRIVFTPSFDALCDPDENVIVDNLPLAVDLDDEGGFELVLPATNDPDATPIDWTYQVTEPTGRVYNIQLPADIPGGTLDLVDAVPSGIASPGIALLARRLRDSQDYGEPHGAPQDRQAIAWSAAHGRYEPTTLDFYTDEHARDAIGAALVGGTAVGIVVDDANDTITISTQIGSTAGTAAAGNDARITGAAQKTDNLGDLASAAAARTNLGLGGAAQLAVGTGAGSVAAGDDTRITGAAQKAANLTDLTSAAAARTALGLGTAATLPVGTGSGTVTAGDDSRITGAAQKASNLADLSNAATARTNLGLGNSATRAVGTAAGTVAAGDDTRIAGAAQKAANLSDVADLAAARANLAAAPALTPTSTKTANYTATAGELVKADATSGNLTITIPTGTAGAIIGVRKTDSSSNTVTVTDGASVTFTLRLPDESRVLYGQSGTWFTALGLQTTTGLDTRYLRTATATAKGDLLAATGSAALTRLPVGANGYTLIAEPGEATGLKYEAPAAGLDVRAFGADPTGTTDSSAAFNAAMTAAAAAGVDVFASHGTYLFNTPIAGKTKVRIRGTGRGTTTLKASASFAPTSVSDGGGLIEWQGDLYDSSPSQPIFTHVGVSDLTIDMSAAPDTTENIVNAIWQDYSQLRHCTIERIEYIGKARGQGILLNGLGRITGGNSYDITIRDITARNGAGTVSLYLNSVTDATATYHGVTIGNIWSEITTISGIVDDRVAVCGGQVSDAGTLALVHDITISNVKTVIQPGATVTGLVNGVKLDTGKAVTIRNVTIRDIYMWGNGSTTVSGNPVNTQIGSHVGTLGGLQDILIDGVYAWHTAGLSLEWRRVDDTPGITVRNIHLNGVVTGSTGQPYGIILYCMSAPAGDELVLVDGVTMDATSGSMTAFGLCSDTPNSGTAHGGSGQTIIRNALVKGFATGISLAKDRAGSAATQSGWNNVSISDIVLASYSTAASWLSKTFRARNVTGVTDN